MHVKMLKVCVMLGYYKDDSYIQIEIMHTTNSRENMAVALHTNWLKTWFIVTLQILSWLSKLFILHYDDYIDYADNLKYRFIMWTKQRIKCMTLLNIYNIQNWLTFVGYGGR